MGLILDSSVLIAGERRRESVSRVLARIHAACGDTVCAISVITIIDLTHGIYRARVGSEQARRQAFVDELARDVIVHPVSMAIARLAGQIEGEQAGRGISIAIEDLVIGVTALHLGFDLATHNVRHFQRIPGLVVREPN